MEFSLTSKAKGKKSKEKQGMKMEVSYTEGVPERRRHRKPGKNECRKKSGIQAFFLKCKTEFHYEVYWRSFSVIGSFSEGTA